MSGCWRPWPWCRARSSCPTELRRQAYRDGALRIAEGQTISQPWIVARMAELLDLEGPERVLEVGTGSGYAAAVLSRLCSHVVTVERHASLARAAAETLARLGYGNVEVRHGDGCAGRARPRALRRDLGDRHRRRGAAPRSARPSRARGADRTAAAAQRSRAAGADPRHRVETVTAVRFVPLIDGTED